MPLLGREAGRERHLHHPCAAGGTRAEPVGLGGAPGQARAGGGAGLTTAAIIRPRVVARSPEVAPDPGVRRLKLLRPRLPGDAVARPRLLAALDRGRDRPLLLLSSPAGWSCRSRPGC